MLKVALTGGIATGKSYVLSRLRERDVPCIDADDVVHELLGSGTQVTKAIASEFGEAFLSPDGGIDRTRLGAKVFGDPGSRRRLEAILHPVVYATISRWYDALERPMGVASIPLLYETRREADFDFVAATVCPPEQQIERLILRDGVSAEEARQRMAAQMPAEDKAHRANFVIRTGGTTAATDRQVDELLIALHDLSV